MIDFWWGSGIADDVPALTYFLLACLAPFALGVGAGGALIAAGYLPPMDIARQIAQYLPPGSTRQQITQLVLDVRAHSPRVLIFAVACMLWTASGALRVLERSMNRQLGRLGYGVVRSRARNLLLAGLVCGLVLLAAAATGLAAGVGRWVPLSGGVAHVGGVVGAWLLCMLLYRLVPRGGLVRQRLDVRRRDREHRVGQAGEPDALALGDQLEVGGDGVKRARLGVGDRELLLGVAAEDALAEIAPSGLVGELDRIGPVRLHGDDGDVLAGNDASETQAGLEVFESRHGVLS